jgi:hypothetical protein
VKNKVSESYIMTLKRKREVPILPVGTKAIWLYFNGKIDAFKNVTIIAHHKDGLGGPWAIVEDEEGNQQCASWGMLIKTFDK